MNCCIYTKLYGYIDYLLLLLIVLLVKRVTYVWCEYGAMNERLESRNAHELYDNFVVRECFGK